MTNLQLTNKKTQYSAKSEGTNVRIEGTVTVDGSLKVEGFTGQIYTKVSTSMGMGIGSFNYSENNASTNMQQSIEFLAETSQLVLDTVKGVETELATA